MKQQMNGQSFSLAEQNIEQLRKIFPQVWTDEGKIDFAMLQAILGEAVEDTAEHYQFTWHNKKAMIASTVAPSKGTLRPVLEKSVDFQTTENVYIEGDNLEVLKLLQKSYNGKIKLIYIDPPYNTGKDFVYKDNFRNSMQSYLHQTGQVDSDGNARTANTETSGRFHTNWLNMMYPRLQQARHLLTEDGVLLVHIDEHEIDNLQRILKEIFGETNELGTMIWNKLNPKGDAKGISVQHEYIVLYAKHKPTFLEHHTLQREKPNAKKMLQKASELMNLLGQTRVPQELIAAAGKFDFPKEALQSFTVTYDLALINKEFKAWISKQDDLSGGERAYNQIDAQGNVYRGVSMAWPNSKPAPADYFQPLIHPVTNKPCPVPEKGWRNPPETMAKLLRDGKILFGPDETTQPTRKYILAENIYENVSSIYAYGGSDDKLFKAYGLAFDNPKPLAVVKDLMQLFVRDGDYVLDFFSGSATTAHAAMQLNAEDGGKRKFIVVQLPEQLDEKSAMYKKGYKTICDIGQARIRQAGEAIRAVQPNVDVGFRVFELAASNIREWQSDFAHVEETLALYTSPFVEGRTAFDVVYELMLKQGVRLTANVTMQPPLYLVDEGRLIICLERITDAAIEAIIAEKAMGTIVMLADESFTSDAHKLNCLERLKQAGYAESSLIVL